MTTYNVSTHSRAEAAACYRAKIRMVQFRFQHTAARRRLHAMLAGTQKGALFQHTAARRRLLEPSFTEISNSTVSTHSRAEAAAICKAGDLICIDVSTHSRAEAAANSDIKLPKIDGVSTHSRAEAAAQNRA